MFDFLIDIVPREEMKASKKGMMEAHMMYQQHIQQQQAMVAHYMQTHGQNPAMWQQMQAAFQAAQQAEEGQENTNENEGEDE